MKLLVPVKVNSVFGGVMDWLSLLVLVEVAWFIFLAREMNRELDEVRKWTGERLKELTEAEVVVVRQRARLEQLSKDEF